jgi:hypothetical protein
MPMDHMVAGEAMNHGLRIRLFGMLGTGAIGVFIYCRVAGLSFRRVLDVFALPTLTGLAIHRIGCHLAGCCWGDIVGGEHAGELATQVQTTSFLQSIVDGVQYPPGSLPFEQHVALGLLEPDALASLPVYPVQLYRADRVAVACAMASRAARDAGRSYDRGLRGHAVLHRLPARRRYRHPRQPDDHAAAVHPAVLHDPAAAACAQERRIIKRRRSF